MRFVKSHLIDSVARHLSLRAIRAIILASLRTIVDTTCLK